MSLVADDDKIKIALDLRAIYFYSDFKTILHFYRKFFSQIYLIVLEQ